MDLQLSSHAVASLVVRLCAPKLTPIAKAAHRHEGAMKRVFLNAVKEAQDAVPMQELIDVLSLGHPGTGAPLYVLQDVIDMMLEETQREVEHRPYMRSAAEGSSVGDILGAALEAGAGATELCVIDKVTPKVTSTKGVPASVTAKIEAQLQNLPQSFLARARVSGVEVVVDAIPGHPNAVGLMRWADDRLFVRAGVKGTDVASILRHELGHALDGPATRALSSNAEFVSAFRADLKTFGKRPGDFFVKHYALNEREAFAQSVSYLSGKIPNRAEFVKAFGKSIEQARVILAEQGIVF